MSLLVLHIYPLRFDVKVVQYYDVLSLASQNTNQVHFVSDTVLPFFFVRWSCDCYKILLVNVGIHTSFELYVELAICKHDNNVVSDRPTQETSK